MGKNGDRLRAEKDNRVVYHFSKAQLLEHDKMVAQIAIEQRKKELRAVVDRNVDEVMREYFNEEREIDIYKVLLYALSVSCKVLIERFGWSPIRKRIDPRMRVFRFAMGVQEELEEIKKYKDLRTYSKEVYDKYGVGWITTDDEEGK